MATATVAELPDMKEEFKGGYVGIPTAVIMSIIARLDGAPQATEGFQIIAIDIFHHQLGVPLATHPLLFRSASIITPRK